MISIAVQGASGGLGASSLVAAVAVRGAQSGRQVVCVDHVSSGGGLDVVLGIEQRPGLRWPDLRRARGHIDGAELVGALPSRRGVHVLAADRAHPHPVAGPAVRAVRDALVDAADLVIHDLPDPAAASWPGAVAGHDLVVLLAGSLPHQVSAAAAGHALLREAGSSDGADRRTALVVRGRSGDDAHALAGMLDLPLVAVLREDRALPGALARGAVPGAARGPLRDAADLVLLAALRPVVAA
ncbi:hypothetical protein [Arsenicicoccus dermatophilus]|uniref:hypothetical protein n=1 Tax=Arsenicicoccus dermatophilus TaxID=1076331 RepID=UPI003917495D